MLLANQCLTFRDIKDGSSNTALIGEIPARHGSARTSGLPTTVIPGTNTVPLELSSKP